MCTGTFFSYQGCGHLYFCMADDCEHLRKTCDKVEGKDNKYFGECPVCRKVNMDKGRPGPESDLKSDPKPSIFDVWEDVYAKGLL